METIKELFLISQFSDYRKEEEKKLYNLIKLFSALKKQVLSKDRVSPDRDSLSHYKTKIVK
jgi:hypothetical protein